MSSTPPDQPSAGPTRWAKLVAAAFAISGVAHLAVPKVFESIVPGWVPKPRAMVYASGIVELACSAGLATQQSWAGPASAGLLVAVWPANIQMAIDGSASTSRLRQMALWARVPLQLPMIKAVLGARAS